MKSDLWIDGHTHSEFDYTLVNSRVVCNPRGHSKNQDKQENTKFATDNGCLNLRLKLRTCRFSFE